MNSTKTTIAGACVIIGALLKAYNEYQTGQVDINALSVALVAGAGLLAARDNSKSSEDAGAK